MIGMKNCKLVCLLVYLGCFVSSVKGDGGDDYEYIVTIKISNVTYAGGTGLYAKIGAGLCEDFDYTYPGEVSSVTFESDAQLKVQYVEFGSTSTDVTVIQEATLKLKDKTPEMIFATEESFGNQSGYEVKKRFYVGTKPTITSSAKVLVLGGHELVLSCSVNFSNPMDAYEWYHDSILIPGANASSQTVAPLRKNNGSYTCEAVHPFISLNKSDPLVLSLTLPRPTVVSADDHYKFGGAEITLTCNAPTLSKYGEPSFSWQLNNNTVADAVQKTYTVPTSSSRYAGGYTCRVELNGTVSAASEIKAILVIGFAPTVIAAKDRRSYKVGGEAVTLSCVSVLNGPLEYEWKVNDTVVKGRTEIVYVLPTTDKSSKGSYACSCSFTVTIPFLPIPPIPVKYNSTNVVQVLILGRGGLAR